jgi:hypothetical protein
MIPKFQRRYILLFCLCFIVQPLFAQISVDSATRKVFARQHFAFAVGNPPDIQDAKTSTALGLFNETVHLSVGFATEPSATQNTDIQLNANALMVSGDGSETSNAEGGAFSSLTVDFSLANAEPYTVDASVETFLFKNVGIVSLEDLLNPSTIFSIVIGDASLFTQRSLSMTGVLPAGSYRLTASAANNGSPIGSDFHLNFAVGNVPDTGSTFFLTAFGLLALVLGRNKKAARYRAAYLLSTQPIVNSIAR